MTQPRTTWKIDPGLVASGSAHVGLLVVLLVGFAFPSHLEAPTEAIAVEMVSASEMNQIMNGEEKAKPLPAPLRRVDKLAELEERRPTPPLAEAKKDTPPPPSPEPANDDPGRDEKKTEAVASKPPAPLPPVPTPPERPVVKAETPPPLPPQRPQAEPPAPDDAEALAPKPPPRPKVKDTKDEAKPDSKPDTKVAKVTPPPPKRPDPPKKPEPKADLDQVAKLLDSMKPPKPATKVRAGNEAKDQPRHDFSVDKISEILDHEAPQHKGSTGRQLTQLASLGAPNAHADKMSPSMTAQLDGWMIDKYRGCWSYFGLGATQAYVPEVRVTLAQDGSLIGQPALLNPPSDPNLRSLADSAIRAVNRCNPMAMPERFKPYYESWRQRTVRFDPKQMS